MSQEQLYGGDIHFERDPIICEILDSSLRNKKNKCVEIIFG